ncbi:MAG: 50S ribosome-binding GTPase [Acidobacteria bacterium]|nr:50S ribosome-binding GTPase [Acidobacteriota bacterium]
MPANLTPQYLAAEQRFKDATTTQEKVEALEEMMAVIPKHKGTEKLQADLRRRLAKLRNEAGKKHGISKASAMYSIQRDGAGQVVLIGGANAGKSSLLSCLTHATPEIGDYPFTTRLPQPGMMPYENIKIQLVDIPPIDPNYYEPWMGGIVRQADLALLVVDLGTDDLLDEIESVSALLSDSRIRLSGNTGPENEQSPFMFCRTLIVANKCDAPDAQTNLEILREFFGSRFLILPVSAKTGEGLDPLRQKIFEELNIVRIYTKLPGKKADLSSPPFVLKHGSTVLDAARAVHREFVHALKSAKIWSSEKSRRSVKYDGQMVERTHQLEDGDILELHI